MEKIERLYTLFRKSKGVCTDSRADVAGRIFIGLKGESFDGSRFAEDVLNRGALCAVIGDADL